MIGRQFRCHPHTATIIVDRTEWMQQASKSITLFRPMVQSNTTTWSSLEYGYVFYRNKLKNIAGTTVFDKLWWKRRFRERYS
ncbi:hypothetical protein AVEN_167425-1 [Araneus ventricosus]|uniref:Uncharacterized protein n=1 Tax=Araneus ventricosus TaxID=182803 RepID=A0A4Y2K7F0_ARAVE|nr:hypothetical protein AVEN_167425-1 [Araneus ventricosus]